MTRFRILSRFQYKNYDFLLEVKVLGKYTETVPRPNGTQRRQFSCYPLPTHL